MKHIKIVQIAIVVENDQADQVLIPVESLNCPHCKAQYDVGSIDPQSVISQLKKFYTEN